MVEIGCKLDGLERDKPGAAGGTREAVKLECPLERREALGVNVSEDAGHATIVRYCGPGGELGVSDVARQARRPKQCFAKGRFADLALGFAEADENLAALSLLDWSLLVLKRQCLLKPAKRLVGIELGQRASAGEPGVLPRLTSADRA
jgi:hypothetical protein